MSPLGGSPPRSRHWPFPLPNQLLVLASAAHILKNWNNIKQINVAPLQGWQANSWSIPYFWKREEQSTLMYIINLLSLLLLYCRHLELIVAITLNPSSPWLASFSGPGIAHKFFWHQDDIFLFSYLAAATKVVRTTSKLPRPQKHHGFPTSFPDPLCSEGFLLGQR